MISQEDKLTLASNYLQQLLILNAPKDTFNLARNAIRLVQVDPNYWKIVIGGEIAPYAIYTTKQHHVNKYTGVTNFDWVNRTINQAIPYIKQIFGGALSQDTVNTAIEDLRNEQTSQAVRNE